MGRRINRFSIYVKEMARWKFTCLHQRKQPMEENSGSARIFFVRKYFFNISLCVACACVCSLPWSSSSFYDSSTLTHLYIKAIYIRERLDTLLLLFMVIFIYRGQSVLTTQFQSTGYLLAAPDSAEACEWCLYINIKYKLTSTSCCMQIGRCFQKF